MAASTTLKFALKIGSLSEDTFRVYEFQLSESMSECYSLKIRAASSDGEIVYADLIGQRAVLTITGESFAVEHCGKVTAFDYAPAENSDSGEDTFVYSLLIEPGLRLLSYSSQSRIFQNKDVIGIVTEVLQAAAFLPNDFRFETQGHFPKRPFTVQYNETNLNFIQRLLDEEGIWYFFDHSDGRDTVVFADTITSYKPVPHTPVLPLIRESGLSHLHQDHILGIRRLQKMHTGQVLIRDYNTNTPEINLTGRVAGEGVGEAYLFNPHVLNTDQAERLAQIKLEGLARERNILTGNGICRAFRSGLRFRLDGAGIGFDGDLLLTHVLHIGNQREGFEGDKEEMIYSNEFTCIPSSLPYRPRSNAVKPKVPGVLSAKVSGLEGQYAYLDGQGRYHAKFPFDLSDLGKDVASQPIPRMQPYAGPNYGMHFPLHNGNELVVAFIDGDIDRPIALGALPNPSNGDAVTSANKTESVIRTATGHQIRLDDTENKTTVDITTHGLHKISLSDDPALQEIRLHSTDKHELILDDTQQNILMRTTDNGHIIKLDNKNAIMTLETKYGHTLTLDDATKSLCLQTKSGHLIRFDDENELLTLSDGKSRQILQINAKDDTITLSSEGDIFIKAKRSFQVEAAEIRLEAVSAGINAKAAKEIHLQATTVLAHADKDLTLQGDLSAHLKSAKTTVAADQKLELKSDGANHLLGASINAEASGVNTIQGAVVLIN